MPQPLKDFQDAILAQSPTPLTPKQHALRALNAETTTTTKALNQAQSAIAHALRTIENHYQKRRAEIINRSDEIIT
jgi:hypothetical protein